MVVRDSLMDMIERLSGEFRDVQIRIKGGDLGQSAVDQLEDLLAAVNKLDKNCPEDQLSKLDKLHAGIHGELGLLAGVRGSLDSARKHIDQAIELLGGFPDDPQSEEFTIIATQYLNAGSMSAAAGDFEKAETTFASVIDRLRPHLFTRPENGRLWLSAVQNRALFRERSGRLDEAEADLTLALDVAESASEKDPKQWLHRAFITCNRLVEMATRQKRPDVALKWAQHEMKLADRLVEASVGPFGADYVRARMDLAKAFIDTGQFDMAEDHIFGAIESASEHVDVVLFGTDLYAMLTTKTEEELQAGGLPRDEVEESYAELLAKLDATSTSEEEKEIAGLSRARYDCLVNARFESAEQALSREPTSERGAIPFLRKHLAVLLQNRALKRV